MNERELDYRLFVTREENVYHMSYTEELDFYNSVKSGDIEKIRQLKDAGYCKKYVGMTPLKYRNYHSRRLEM